MARVIEVVAYNPEWPALYEAEAARLTAVLQPVLVSLYHLGSTAIPGLPAKPTMDLFGEVRDLDALDAFNPALIGLGYEPRGEYGIPQRRYFVRRHGEAHTHHMHLFLVGNPLIQRHRWFCDYLRAHPDQAAAYGRLKQELARQYPHDSAAYTDSKAAFVAEIDRQAALYYQPMEEKKTAL